MKIKKSLSLLSWALWYPLKFAVISFLLMIAMFVILGQISPATNNWLTVLIVVALVVSLVLLYNMPRENMDRRGFVALNNIHMFIISTAFMVMMFLVTAYKNAIVMRLWWLTTNLNPYLLTIAILAALAFLYLFGIFVINIYVKYRRCRAMGISNWKIICSMPFGFALMWIPGYLLKDEDASTPAVAIHSKVYNKVNNWFLSGKNRMAIIFAILTVYSGFFYGFNSAILTLIYAVVFLLWLKLAGLSSFRQHQNKIYSYVAIIMNIIVLIGVIAYSVYSLQFTTPDMTVNISDIPATQIVE